VKPLHFLWPLLALALLGGCCCTTHETYSELRVTDLRGKLISDWIARGPIWKGDIADGWFWNPALNQEVWHVTAVQRTDGPPYPETTYYPDGWHTSVVGPCVHHWHCEKPAWLDNDNGHAK
jgi:hypothetical protein